jgi:hypothetical protein
VALPAFSSKLCNMGKCYILIGVAGITTFAIVTVETSAGSKPTRLFYFDYNSKANTCNPEQPVMPYNLSSSYIT